MLKIQPNSRQVPKAKDICSNKKYYDILYAYLQCISVRDEKSGTRYFSKKDMEVHKFNLCESCYDRMIEGFEVPILIEEKSEAL